MEKRNRGFTMIELLVAMVILVIAFGLVTYLYTKAARIRKIVVINSEVQQALSQMMDTLTYGETNSWGLKDAVKLTDCADEETGITVENATGELMTAEIITDPEEEDGIITLVITRTPPGTQLVVDINRKIQLYAGSKIECFDHTGTWLDPADPVIDLSTTTLVKITFLAKSTDPAFKNAPLIPFVTAVRLCNKPSI
jgi:prepilin-type N-terminal cleavage/methylation domain-containing protein